jgi:hypothetical protein
LFSHIRDTRCYFTSTIRNVIIYDDLVVMFRLFVMEVVSTVMNFVTSSQITSDSGKLLKIITKLEDGHCIMILFRHG